MGIKLNDMDKRLYTDKGIFINKGKAMDFRNKNYRWCSCYTENENGRIRLWIKIPK